VAIGQDRRNWLVSFADGTYPVGQDIRLPDEFYLECRYSIQMKEATRGAFGWWKPPISTTISFLDDQGAKYAIEWSVGCEDDMTRHDPPGSSIFAKKYYHIVKLPGGATNEVGVIQPTGILRINRHKEVIKVLVDGRLVVAGAITQVGQLVRFEASLVKNKNNMLSLTDFKIAR
jgi:hypothetical protein